MWLAVSNEIKQLGKSGSGHGQATRDVAVRRSCMWVGRAGIAGLRARMRHRRVAGSRRVNREIRGKGARRPVSRVLSARCSGGPGRRAGRPFLWDAHCCAPRATNPGGVAGSPCVTTCVAAGRPYSVLLPVGFALPPPLPGARCALAAPFHPCPRGSLLARAVCFLWHFPWGRPRRPLTGTVFPWSPDFPPPGPLIAQRARQRPSGRLAPPQMRARPPRVN